MSLLDPIKPYLAAIKVGVCLVLLVGSFISGCSYRANKADRDIASLQIRLTTAESANMLMSAAVEEANRQAKANRQFADQQYEQAQKSAKELEEFQREQDKKEAKWKTELEKARKDPTCNETLRLKLCPTVPLPMH